MSNHPLRGRPLRSGPEAEPKVGEAGGRGLSAEAGKGAGTAQIEKLISDWQAAA
jgi:hypothetical protein